MGITLPEGWILADTTINIGGLLNPEVKLQLSDWPSNTWVCWIVDSLTAPTANWEFLLINTKDEDSKDTITIFMWDGWDNTWNERKEIIIQSTENTKIPTQFSFKNRYLQVGKD